MSAQRLLNGIALAVRRNSADPACPAEDAMKEIKRLLWVSNSKKAQFRLLAAMLPTDNQRKA